MQGIFDVSWVPSWVTLRLLKENKFVCELSCLLSSKHQLQRASCNLQTWLIKELNWEGSAGLCFRVKINTFLCKQPPGLWHECSLVLLQNNIIWAYLWPLVLRMVYTGVSLDCLYQLQLCVSCVWGTLWHLACSWPYGTRGTAVFTILSPTVHATARDILELPRCPKGQV